MLDEETTLLFLPTYMKETYCKYVKNIVSMLCCFHLFNCFLKKLEFIQNEINCHNISFTEYS